MGAVFKREFKGYFTTPIGYVFFVVMLFFAGLSFSQIYAAGYSDLTYVFNQIFSISLFAVPVLTMRLISEDRRQKVDQALFTAPVSITSIVLGKFFATLCVYVLSLGITLIFQFIFALYVSVDWTVYLSNLIGVALLGGALIAIGIFISALTENQLVSAIGSFAVSLVLLQLDTFSGNETVATVISYFSFSKKYSDFVIGVLNYSNIVFFLSVAGLFLFLTVRALEKKRWA